MTNKKPDVVTFATYLSDGILLLQQRGFLRPDGFPVEDAGKLSLNGGTMKTHNEIVELMREVDEELGLTSQYVFYEHIGNVYDNAHSRYNLVFRVKNYDTNIWRQEEKSPELSAIHAIFKTEGIGRAAVYREELIAAITAGMLTSISVKILEEFPQLMPPKKFD